MSNVVMYECEMCGAVGPGDKDREHWYMGPISGGGILVTHWCNDTDPGPPFATGWHTALPHKRPTMRVEPAAVWVTVRFDHEDSGNTTIPHPDRDDTCYPVSVEAWAGQPLYRDNSMIFKQVALYGAQQPRRDMAEPPWRNADNTLTTTILQLCDREEAANAGIEPCVGWAPSIATATLRTLLTAYHDEAASTALEQWALDRWKAEVEHRPIHNVHRKTLDAAWRQVYRYATDGEEIPYPTHREMVAAAVPDKPVDVHDTQRCSRCHNNLSDASDDGLCPFCRENVKLEEAEALLNVVRSFCTSEHSSVVTGSTQHSLLALSILAEIGIGDATMQIRDGADMPSPMKQAMEAIKADFDKARDTLDDIRSICNGTFGPGTSGDMVVVIEQTLDEYYGVGEDSDDAANS